MHTLKQTFISVIFMLAKHTSRRISSHAMTPIQKTRLRC